MRHLISSGSSFEDDIGYSRAVVDGEWVFVSGTTGFDYATMTIADDVAVQTEQCLANIAAALREARATFAMSCECATFSLRPKIFPPAGPPSGPRSGRRGPQRP